MRQQRVGRITAHLLTIGIGHQISLYIQCPLKQILIQNVGRDQRLFKDQIDQLGFVVGRDIGSNILRRNTRSSKALHLVRERLGVGINVGAAHQLMADILNSRDVLIDLETTISHHL